MFIAALFTIAKEWKQAKYVVCVNGENVAVFFINKNEWSSYTCYKMDEPQMSY